MRKDELALLGGYFIGVGAGIFIVFTLVYLMYHVFPKADSSMLDYSLGIIMVISFISGTFILIKAKKKKDEKYNW